MLIQANALHIPLKDGCVQCVVTSPPYWGLRDYGTAGQLGLEPTPAEYVEKMVAVFREVKRVLRGDGTLWLNLGDSYAGSGKGRNADGTHQEGGKQGTNAGTVVGLLTKTEAPDGLKPKDLVGIPWRVAFALQADGWWLRSDIIWAKPNPMPESVTDRPTKAHEYLFLMAKSGWYYYNNDAIREPSEDKLGTDRFKNGCGVGDRSSGGEVSLDKHREYNPLGRNKRSVWTVTTQPYKEAHFATFPEALVEPCILAGSRPGDLVLDPFTGSGTVLRVARGLQRKAVGIDLSRKYLELANARSRKVQVGMFV